MRKTINAHSGMAQTLSACGSPRPPEHPPAPPTTGGEAVDPNAVDPNGQSGGVGQAALPGSQADFIQNVGSDRVLFALDSSSLDGAARATLDQQAAWLQRNATVNVTVEGHADERGTREYNLALGDRRANAVRNYLESRGVSAGRMTTISWGKERPEVEGSGEQAYAQNRRAVTVVPQ